MIAYINCYLGCIWSSGILPLLVVLTALTVSLFLVYKIKKNAQTMMIAQVAATILIPTNLALMLCRMSALSWAYVGIVGTGAMVLGLLNYTFSRRTKDTLPTPSYIRELETKFGVDISILKWPRVSAFTYKGRVFLSEDLLHKLGPDEIGAVVAHEAHHSRSDHSRTLASLLAITSLTFTRHRDEEKADRFAEAVAGTKHLENALLKLDITDCQKRMDALASTNVEFDLEESSIG